MSCRGSSKKISPSQASDCANRAAPSADKLRPLDFAAASSPVFTLTGTGKPTYCRGSSRWRVLGRPTPGGGVGIDRLPYPVCPHFAHTQYLLAMLYFEPTQFSCGSHALYTREAPDRMRSLHCAPHANELVSRRPHRGRPRGEPGQAAQQATFLINRTIIRDPSGW